MSPKIMEFRLLRQFLRGVKKLPLIWGVVLLAFLIASPVVGAEVSRDYITNNFGFYSPDLESGCASLAGVSTATTLPASEAQIQNAKTIIGIAKTENLGQQGALIGLMVGMDETHLLNLANSNVPVSANIPSEGVGSDEDSVGVFQQRPSTGWSTIATGPEAVSNPAAVAQLMTPAYAAEAFFGSPPGSGAPSALSKGLQNKADWQTAPPWLVAQEVQVSGTGDGSNYKAFLTQAQSLISQYWDSSPAIPLPVPLSGGNVSGGSDPTSGCPNAVSGNAQELAQQILANKNIQLAGRLAQEDVQAAANNQPGSSGVMTSAAILQLISTVGQNHSVTVSAIQSGGTGHCNDTPKAACPDDAHYTGDGVDFSEVDGVALTGRDSGSLVIMQAGFTILPTGSGFGQSNCGTTPPLPSGFITFPDSCNHLHVQVPKGSA